MILQEELQPIVISIRIYNLLNRVDCARSGNHKTYSFLIGYLRGKEVTNVNKKW